MCPTGQVIFQSGHVLIFPAVCISFTGLVQILAGHMNIFAGHVNFQNHVPDRHVNQMLNVNPLRIFRTKGHLLVWVPPHLALSSWWEPDRCRPTSVNIITMGCCSAAGCRQPHRKPHRGDRNRSVCFVSSRFRSLRSQSNRFVKFLGNFSKHVLTTKIVFVTKNDVDLKLQQSRYVEYWRS